MKEIPEVLFSIQNDEKHDVTFYKDWKPADIIHINI